MHLWWNIPCTANSHYEKKNLKTGKNLLVLSKSLLVTTERTWYLMRFSVSHEAFNTSKFGLILSKDFLDLGKEFVYEKMTTYKIVLPIFSMRIFSTLKQIYSNKWLWCTWYIPKRHLISKSKSIALLSRLTGHLLVEYII